MRRFVDSGLYEELVEAGLLIPASIDWTEGLEGDTAALLRPERIAFISYPYEWCFSQLKSAALLTLDIAERGLQKGLVLKDASAYNVQFLGARPILIDSLSFETYREGEPWIAYGQFCRHFLAPLALIAHTDVRLAGLIKVHIDGVPLDLAAKLLPSKTKLNLGLLLHIHAHAKAVRGAKRTTSGSGGTVSKQAQLALLHNLRATVQGLRWTTGRTDWSDYYSETNYGEALAVKREMVSNHVQQVRTDRRSCWDLGANTGEFAKLAAEAGYLTVAWDLDPAAVEKAFLAQGTQSAPVLPLVQDLTNPSPDLG
ncbi:MAG TPA: hypothetical protein VM328_08070, partial [Fimbriimonadaceae bacterium]|nr:hypothetical protein [Fimbriimonadaceae bacterium]